MTPWVKDTAERAARTFLQAYLTLWIVVGGTDFDALFTVENLKAGVVGIGLSVAMAVGAKQTGNPDDASYFERGQTNALLLLVFIIGVFVGAVMHSNGWLFD